MSSSGVGSNAAPYWLLSEAATVPGRYFEHALRRIIGRANSGRLGHTVRLMPPAYVKPYIKRHKNDAVDAEAICEAVTKTNMRLLSRRIDRPSRGGVDF